MVLESRATCSNCDEALVVSYVLVKRPSTDKAPHECPLCEDRETVASILEAARERAAGRRPLLLGVRHVSVRLKRDGEAPAVPVPLQRVVSPMHGKM